MDADVAQELFETIAAFIVAITIILAAAWRIARPHIRDFVQSVKDVETQVKPNGNRPRDEDGRAEHESWSLHDLASEAKRDAAKAQEAAATAAEATTKTAHNIDTLMEFAATNRAGILALNRRVQGLADDLEKVEATLEVAGRTIHETQIAVADHVAEGERFLTGALEQLSQQGIYLSSRPDQPDPAEES